MIVIADSSIIIGLGGIGRLALLHDLFDEVIIPEAVRDELMTSDDTEFVKLVSEASWLRTIPIRNELAVKMLFPLDKGESEVIVLAYELAGPDSTLALIDEKKARQKLAYLGVPITGILGILLEAKERGLLPAVRPEIDKLRETGFILSKFMVEYTLDQAGEFAG